MLNNVVIMGRLTADIELRMTKNQVPVSTFTIACDREVPDSEGNRQTDFIDCLVWRSIAEFAAKNIHKGDLINVCGRLQFNNRIDANGNKRRESEILVESLYLCKKKQLNTEAQTV